jgi:hypothetical protein
MKRISLLLATLAAALILLTDSGFAGVRVGIGIAFGPPPPRHEVVVVAPRPGCVWVPGYWSWAPARRHYVWVGGRWIAGRPGHAWVNGRWHHGPHGWFRTEGHWRSR